MQMREMIIAGVYTALWMCASSGLILLNKYILSNLDFHYPLTLSSLGMGFSSLASAILIHVLKTHKLETKGITHEFYLHRIFPLGFLMAATLGFGNLAYLYLSVSFIQILKAATPVMTMAILVLVRLDKLSTPVTIAVSIIAFGTAVSSWGELAFSMLGFIIMVTSEFCEACKLAAMQFLLGNMKLQLMEGIYYFTPAGFVWMAIFIVPLELGRMRDEGALDIVLGNPMAFLLAATLGFFVNLLSFGVIQTTSSLTFKVLGQLKNVAVVLCSVFLFASVVSGLQAFGYLISIVGFFLYNKAKSGPAAAPVAGKDAEVRSSEALVEVTTAVTGEILDGGTPAARNGSVFSRQSVTAHVRNMSIPELPTLEAEAPRPAR